MTHQNVQNWLTVFFYKEKGLESTFAYSAATHIGFVENRYNDNSTPEDEAQLLQNAASTFRHMTAPDSLRGIFILAQNKSEVLKAQAQGATLLPVRLRLPPFETGLKRAMLTYNPGRLETPSAADLKNAIRIICRAHAAANGIEFSKDEPAYGRMMRQADRWASALNPA